MPSAESSLDETRRALHRVATHVLARRRYQESGRFGLRVSPGGISTPMFGPNSECIRISVDTLVHDVGGYAGYTPISGSSLRSLAEAVRADIDADFVCGADTPALGDPDEVLHLDPEVAQTLARWYQLGWVVLDATVSRLPKPAEVATLQLWPEHFDIGTNVKLANGEGVNLGCSPGDSYVPEPYLYVGPWSAARPGDAEHWNASFGAARTRSEVVASTDPIEYGVRFMTTGLDSLSLQEASQ